jgi:hypothetical protein
MNGAAYHDHITGCLQLSLHKAGAATGTMADMDPTVPDLY